MDDSFMAAYKKARLGEGSRNAIDERQPAHSASSGVAGGPARSATHSVAGGTTNDEPAVATARPSFLQAAPVPRSSDQSAKSKPKKRLPKLKFPHFSLFESRKTPALLALVGTVVLGALVFGIVRNRQAGSFASPKTDTKTQAQVLAAKQDLAKQYLEQVKRLIDLETDEHTTVATITNVEKLRDRSAKFFAAAKNGDVLVITAKKAVLYNPKKQLIVNVAAVDIHTQADALLESNPASPSANPELLPQSLFSTEPNQTPPTTSSPTASISARPQ